VRKCEGLCCVSTAPRAGEGQAAQMRRPEFTARSEDESRTGECLVKLQTHDALGVAACAVWAVGDLREHLWPLGTGGTLSDA
jgi:hypothetical protein